jgi:hypothetical protein
VKLIGAQHPRDELKPVSFVSVDFVFEVLKKPPADWKIFLHGEAAGTKLKNLDHTAVDGLYPVEDWEPGDFVVDNVRFNIPKRARDEYVLWLGFYHPKEGRAEVHGLETDDKKRGKAVTLRLAAPPPKKTRPKAPKKAQKPVKPK